MPDYFFVSDLHGNPGRYQHLFSAIRREKPDAVFLGGDLLPSGFLSAVSGDSSPDAFIQDVLEVGFETLKGELGVDYPRVFLILGNDDTRSSEDDLRNGEKKRLWEYIHNKAVDLNEYLVFGYAYVPPTPFLLKDWERFDVSRFTDVGCIPPEEGWRTVPVDESILQFATISEDLDRLSMDVDLSNAIFLFHAPPYHTHLDRAALDGKYIEHVPLDVHIGSIAIKRFIEARQPRITLHGHVHESSRLTSFWHEKIGRTFSFSAALEGQTLSLIRFDPNQPENARRILIDERGMTEESVL